MRPSSVIAITRGDGDGLEVFWSQRRHDLAFLGGFWAFAGGRLDDSDSEIPLVGHIPPGFPEPSHYGCAAREVFEEMGLWVTDHGLRHVSEDPSLAGLRDRIETPGDFAGALRTRGELVDVERFHPVGRWRTPEWFGTPFESEFFAVALTDEEDRRFGAALAAHLQTEELRQGEWTSPSDALAAWGRAERYMTLPIRRHLESFETVARASQVDVHSSDEPIHYDAFEMMPGIYMFPLKSPTIPPATHTNCIVVGRARFVVIDPGSPYESEQEALAAFLGQMIDDGRRFEAVVLTHHHVDHVSGVEDLLTRFGVPVWAHRCTADQVSFKVDRLLDDGDLLELDDHPIECRFTPGHASGHLCFLHRPTHAVFGGDLIASRGTILVNPPDGHMGQYMQSLAAVRDIGAAALYPAHGWIVTNPAERLQFYIDHRLAREEKVFEALKRFGRPATAADLVPDAYDDAPPAVWPIATRSAQAHLIHLAELGRIVKDGACWHCA